MRRWSIAALAVVLGLAGSACNRSSPRAVGQLRVDGRSEVVTVDGGLREVTRSLTLKAGEQVTVTQGTATLSLGSGRQLELREGTVMRLALRPDSSGRMQPQGELLRGNVSVVAPSEDSATVVAGDSTVDVTGAARISRSLAVVVAVYQGTAGLRTAGQVVSVPALRQVTVPAPGLPSRPSPLVFSAADPSDQRYLGDAMDLGNQLATRSRGFSAQLPAGQGTTAGFFRELLPDLNSQPQFEALLAAGAARPPGETLVGAAIALEGKRGPFPDRWASLFAFHDEGAPWGLVAAEQGVERGPLLATVDAAISRASGAGELAAPAAPSSPSVSASGAPARPLPVPVPSEVGSSVGSPSVGAPDSGSPPPAAPPAEAPPAGGWPGGVPPVQPQDDPGTGLGIPLLDEAVDVLSGLLRAIGG
ncbi:MAG: hypothetical protein ABR540_16425 [Acidimicrobiales bacterium]